MMYRLVRTSVCVKGLSYITSDSVDINYISHLCGSYNEFYCAANCGCFFEIQELANYFPNTEPLTNTYPIPLVFNYDHLWSSTNTVSLYGSTVNTQTANTAIGSNVIGSAGTGYVIADNGSMMFINNPPTIVESQLESPTNTPGANGGSSNATNGSYRIG